MTRDMKPSERIAKECEENEWATGGEATRPAGENPMTRDDEATVDFFAPKLLEGGLPRIARELTKVQLLLAKAGFGKLALGDERREATERVQQVRECGSAADDPFEPAAAPAPECPDAEEMEIAKRFSAGESAYDLSRVFTGGSVDGAIRKTLAYLLEREVGRGDCPDAREEEVALTPAEIAALPENIFHGTDCACDMCEPEAAEIVALRTERDSLKAERERLAQDLEHTQQWYATRCERLWHWAHEDKVHREGYFAIIANGTEGAHEPPTYAQLLNASKHRVADLVAALADAALVLENPDSCMSERNDLAHEIRVLTRDAPQPAQVLSALQATAAKENPPRDSVSEDRGPAGVPVESVAQATAVEPESDAIETPELTYGDLKQRVARLDPFAGSEGAKMPEEPTARFLWGVRYYLGMLEDGDNPRHALGHIQEVIAKYEQHLESLRPKADPAQPAAERPILVGSTWRDENGKLLTVDFVKTAERCASFEDMPGWYEFDYVNEMFTHVSDPAAASEPETVGGESDGE